MNTALQRFASCHLCLRSVSRFLRVAPVAIALAVSCVFIFGCDDGVVTFTGGSSKIRIFNAQTKAAGMSVSVDSVGTFSNLASGVLSDAVTVSSGVFHIVRCQSTSDTTISGLIASQRYIFGDGASYTMVVRGSRITDFIKPVLDSSLSPFAGNSAVRIINATENYVDVYVNGTKLNDIVADVQSAGRLFAAATGTTTIEVRDADTKATLASVSTSLEAGYAYHLFVYDELQNNTTVTKAKVISLH
jgi:hypothetical protein